MLEAAKRWGLAAESIEATRGTDGHCTERGVVVVLPPHPILKRVFEIVHGRAGVVRLVQQPRKGRKVAGEAVHRPRDLRLALVEQRGEGVGVVKADKIAVVLLLAGEHQPELVGRIVRPRSLGCRLVEGVLRTCECARGIQGQKACTG